MACSCLHETYSNGHLFVVFHKQQYFWLLYLNICTVQIHWNECQLWSSITKRSWLVALKGSCRSLHCEWIIKMCVVHENWFLSSLVQDVHVSSALICWSLLVSIIVSYDRLYNSIVRYPRHWLIFEHCKWNH